MDDRLHHIKEELAEFNGRPDRVDSRLNQMDGRLANVEKLPRVLVARSAEPPVPAAPAAPAGEPAGAAAPPAPAGLGRRFAAMFYDALLMAAALYAAAIPAVWVHGGAVPPDEPWFQAWLALVAWFYLAVSWTRGGQTLGMRAWRCRLVTADGGPVGWGRTVARFAVALVSWAALGLGFWWALADPERRTWHDRWSGTRIVIVPR